MGRRKSFCSGVLAILLAATGCLAAETNAVPRDWKSSVYGGFAAKSGNAVERSYNYGGEFSRDGKVYRGKLRSDGRYSKAEDQVTASKAEASGEMRRMLTERWFAYWVVSALHDDLKDLSYRVKTGPGLGYYFVDSKELTVDVSSGPLYVLERTTGGQSGYLAWRFAQSVDWQITSTFRWWFATEAVVDTTDTAAYTVAFKSGVETKINAHLSLIVMVVDDYDSRPEGGADIKKNDFEISTGLRYTF
jgi:putative salt-induced outer membrane protein YdiY